MLSHTQVSTTVSRQSSPNHWNMSSTRFSTNWQVTATLLLDDLDNELECNSTNGPVPRRPAAPVFPSFFALLENEGVATEEAVSFLE